MGNHKLKPYKSLGPAVVLFQGREECGGVVTPLCRELWVPLLKARTLSSPLHGKGFCWAGAWMNPQHLRAAAAPKVGLDKDYIFIFFLIPLLWRSPKVTEMVPLQLSLVLGARIWLLLFCLCHVKIVFICLLMGCGGKQSTGCITAEFVVR